MTSGPHPQSPSAARAPALLTGKPGQTIGSYRLIDPIGAGGMGEVWLAEHGALGRLAAVKLIRADTSTAAAIEQARKRFEREARATSALRSPHTVAIYDFGVSGGSTFYYAMELLEGIGLDVLVERFGRVPPGRAIHLLLGACASLGEAHERGLVHRDIKPSNVFTCVMGLTYDFVKVLDFGLVKQVATDGALTSLTASGAIAGSPAFMPPEAPGGAFTAKADVYSLACVAYWMLTGRLVFQGVTAFEMMLAHAHAQPERPSSQLADELPDRLDDLIMHCLVKKPDDRPTLREVTARLSELSVDAPWRASDAEAWWTEHADELARANLLIDRAQGERRRGDGLTRRQRHHWTERERQAHIDAGLARLQHHFMESHIDMGNLEVRIALVKRATDPHAFELVFADLPELPSGVARETSPLVAAAPARDLAHVGTRPLARPRRDILCVMTHQVRRCSIEPGDHVRAVSVMGYCTLELAGGSMAPGEMRVSCLAVMGGLEITVPADVRVEIESGGLMGMVEQQGSPAGTIPKDRTVVLLQGTALMGLVTIRVKGDTAV